MSYRRFKMREATIGPATVATVATVQAHTPKSVANVASVAGATSESELCDSALRRLVPTEYRDGRKRGDGETGRIGSLVNAGQDWSVEDWWIFFDERAAIAEFDGELPRKEAEARAFACCVVKWLNQNPRPSVPGRCAHCGGQESPGAVVLPFGTEPGTHVWLHAECWSAWGYARQLEAVAALQAIGIRHRGLGNEREN